MPHPPPRGLERLAETLVPPACAEHVLGDLAEGSTSRATYLRGLLSIVPRVVWSQIRRRATFVGIAFNAAIALGALTVFLGLSVANRPAKGWGVAAPWAIWVIGCALAAAYGPREKPFAWNRTLFITTALACLGTAAVAGLPVVRVALAFGLVIVIRLALSRPQRQPAPPPLSLDTVAEHARLFQSRIWWRNLVESIVGVVVVVANVRDLGDAQTDLSRAGHVLLIVGVLFVIGFLNLRANARRLPGDGDVRTIVRFHRNEIERHRDLLRLVPWWYLFPFVPGMLIMNASRWQTSATAVIVGVPILIGVFVLIWRLNVKGAQLLDGELHKVKALEGKL